MALTLYVDTERWRAHIKSVLGAFPGLVPVAKGNGYGFDNVRLAEEVTRFGANLLAVGTTYEAARVKDYFDGDLLVLTPYRLGEDPVPLPDRVIRSVSSVEGVRGLVGARVVIEVMSSMRRHGVTEDDLGKLHSAIEGVRLEGFAIHLPLDRTDGSDAVDEVTRWMDLLRGARLPLHTMFVSHLKEEELGRLQQEYPQTTFRVRIGTRLWLGDHDATEYRGAVLDVTRVAKGDRFGYRQQRTSSDGHLVVVAGGTSHGVGLEAPKAMHGVMPRAKGVARAGLASVNRNLSPFVWAGKQRWFAEPPHMQVSILYLPADVAPPAVGDELVAQLRHTTTHFDRLVDRR
ncbi:alanine racemase [Wenjunlia vitaminophila]|uniref:Alanine racemase n=1 Tax=Wenjunlia vitaminophila TaxID=76728 RepID=A0A0T6LMW9_WENVI|nr:alanine racemase [Wenjunlia vitaminophila]KRV47300.1 alanine racemase [Wenjunlia vitaminophila]